MIFSEFFMAADPKRSQICWSDRHKLCLDDCLAHMCVAIGAYSGLTLILKLPHPLFAH